MPKNVEKEFRLLSKVFGHLAVEFGAQDVPKADVISAIKGVLSEINPTPMPRAGGVLNTLVDYKEFPVVEQNGIISFNNTENEEKGGENMEEKPKDFSCKFTSGETKVAEAVLEKFGEMLLKKTPTKEGFAKCLESSFEKINNGLSATTKMANEGYLEVKRGKITPKSKKRDLVYLGEKGKEYLSL